MYDLPEIRGATDALWTGIVKYLRQTGSRDTADALVRPTTSLVEHWRQPGLLFSQTCGYPLVTTLAGQMRVVAVPAYRFAGCEGATNRSQLIVAAESPFHTLADLRGARVAINGYDSNSGMNLLRAAVAPLAAGGRFFSEITVTGAHAASIEAVGDGVADLASIDCVTWGLLCRWRPDFTARVRVIGETPFTPALPFVTPRRTSSAVVALLRQALRASLSDPAVEPLGLVDVIDPTPGLYRRVSALERQAARLGYPILA